MTSIVNALARASLITLSPTVAVTADGSGTGVDITAYEGVGAVVLDAAASGTGALDQFLEESDDNSTYTDIPATRLIKADGSSGAFTQITSSASAQLRLLALNECKKWLRVRNDVTGSTSITRSVSVLAQKKYQV